MKIRTGFVSNSSSSSFLLVFDKKPKSARDVMEYIWPDESYIPRLYDDWERYPVTQAADAVWEQIKDGKPVTLKDMEEEFIGDEGIYEDIIKPFHASNKSGYDELHKKVEAVAKKMAKDYNDKIKDKYIYRVSFSDNDGHFSTTMEHGDVFSRIPHKRFSHH